MKSNRSLRASCSVTVATSLVAACLVGCASANPDENSEESSDVQALLAGTKLTPSGVASYLREAGFPASAIGPMVCTAKYESAFYEEAYNHNTNGTSDYGLFQINSAHLRDRGCPSTASALYQPLANAECAYEVWRTQGYNAWYGYQAHRATCENYPAP